MTNTLDFKKMENISGGRALSYFCAGFEAGSAVYLVGAWANWWNPVGQTALVVGGVINIGCAAYQLHHL